MFTEGQLPVQLDGTYTLTRPLGRGGMAMVYEADVDLLAFDYALVVAYGETPLGDGSSRRQARRERRYRLWSTLRSIDTLAALCDSNQLPTPSDGKAAVKVLLPHLARASALKRFQAEWQTLMAVGSPYLVQVYGGGCDRQHVAHYFAMELFVDPLEEADLRALPLADKLAVAAQAAAGLAALHQHGVVHRDVKPANLLVAAGPGGRLVTKVADLGLAKLPASGERELTESGALFGTMYYMAPELLGGSKTATPACDIYALGATLYHLLVGAPPYMGFSELEVMGRLHAGRPPQPISELIALPPGVAEVVEQMMHVMADERPASMGRVVDALRRVHTLLPAEERARGRLRLPSRPASGRLATIRTFDDELDGDLVAPDSDDELEAIDVASVEDEVRVSTRRLAEQAVATTPTSAAAPSAPPRAHGTVASAAGPPRRDPGPWPWIVGVAALLAAMVAVVSAC